MSRWTPWQERFWAKVEKGDGCWEWQASKHGHGYGHFYMPRATIPSYAHRVSYELAHGSIPVGLCVLHSCDNPPCVNPAHLRLGTQSENRADCVAKGRHKVPTAPSGSEHPWAKLTERDRQAIRHLRRLVTREILAEAFGVTPKTITAVCRGHYLMAEIKARAAA